MVLIPPIQIIIYRILVSHFYKKENTWWTDYIVHHIVYGFSYRFLYFLRKKDTMLVKYYINIQRNFIILILKKL